ncbi:MAG: thioredoxin domain-containing protein [Planctomycetes bacterium]|nr:thioredoxin domain-containing protein [Planctomycetota bacterium]
MACPRPPRGAAVPFVFGVLLVATTPAQQHNRLADEASPYLRQHADNPVDWYPWGDEALQKAKDEQRPIFLSIGYSACHWCHVMAAESFADAETAKVLNDDFVCIKVDREERPDIDELYMTAVQAMGVDGGWPLSVWLTPDGKPFFGGTYFPPEDSGQRPGFRRICTTLAKTWRDRKEAVLDAAGKLDEVVRQSLLPTPAPGEPDAALLGRLAAQLAERYDEQLGGFGRAPQFAPKFPSPVTLTALLECGAGRGVEMATATLRAIARGGIHDQLAGGFHRYTVDRAWRIPHFEKMLYDNALLAECLMTSSARGGEAQHAGLALETLEWLSGAMQSPDGGFWSSSDAVSSEGEGRTFTWTRAELVDVLGEADAEFAAEVFGVEGDGPVEGRHVLYLAAPPTGDQRHRFAAVRERLLQARAARPQPATDDKVVAAWNALTIRALCRGYMSFGEPALLRSAQRAGGFALEHLIEGGRVRRSVCRGVDGPAGVLEDQAGMAMALLTLFEADSDPRWLASARDVLRELLSHFAAEDGAFWNTADDAPALLVRGKQPEEGSTPSGTGLAAQALLRGGLLLGDDELYQRGVAVLRTWHGYLDQAPAAVPSLVRALAFHVGSPQEIVVVGDADDAEAQALLAAARLRGRPAVVVLLTPAHAERLAELSPLLRDKALVDDRPAVYVCERGTCKAPITSVDELRRLP